MTNSVLKQILEAHNMWLNGEGDGKRADLSYADLKCADLRYAVLRYAVLRDADLTCADLKGANLTRANLTHADLKGADLTRAVLTHANLKGANLDYSAWPLWCGSLNAYIDDRIARQLLYHLMRPCLESPDVSDEFKEALFTPELIAQANQFHRVDECGRIPEQED